MIHKRFFLGLLALNREISAKILYKKQTKRLQQRLSRIPCELILFIISIAIAVMIIIIIITIFITVMTISIIIVFVKFAWRIC